MDNHTSLHKNISLAKKYAFIQYFGITSLWLLYLSSFKGMTLVQIGFLEAIFHITSFVFEVPSGALADRFGYKKNPVVRKSDGHHQLDWDDLWSEFLTFCSCFRVSRRFPTTSTRGPTKRWSSKA